MWDLNFGCNMSDVGAPTLLRSCMLTYTQPWVIMSKRSHPDRRPKDFEESCSFDAVKGFAVLTCGCNLQFSMLFMCRERLLLEISRVIFTVAAVAS